MYVIHRLISLSSYDTVLTTPSKGPFARVQHVLLDARLT